MRVGQPVSAADRAAMCVSLPAGHFGRGQSADRIDILDVFTKKRRTMKQNGSASMGRLNAACAFTRTCFGAAIGVRTALSEDVVRVANLPSGLVDVTICAVGETSDGLMRVDRRDLRKAH